MRDGIEIAVTVVLPPDLKAEERIPALMRTTRFKLRQDPFGRYLRRLP